MIRLLIVLAAFALAACEGDKLPMATATEDASGKAFTPPPSDRTAVYFVQSGGPTIELSLGQRKLGMLGEKNWLRVDVPAGQYDARCNLVVLRDAGAFLPLDLRPGATVFVSTSYVPLGNPSCRLQATDPAWGRNEVMAGQRIQAIRGD